MVDKTRVSMTFPVSVWVSRLFYAHVTCPRETCKFLYVSCITQACKRVLLLSVSALDFMASSAL